MKRFPLPSNVFVFSYLCYSLCSLSLGAPLLMLARHHARNPFLRFRALRRLSLKCTYLHTQVDMYAAGWVLIGAFLRIIGRSGSSGSPRSLSPGTLPPTPFSTSKQALDFLVFFHNDGMPSAYFHGFFTLFCLHDAYTDSSMVGVLISCGF